MTKQELIFNIIKEKYPSNYFQSEDLLLFVDSKARIITSLLHELHKKGLIIKRRYRRSHHTKGQNKLWYKLNIQEKTREH